MVGAYNDEPPNGKSVSSVYGTSILALSTSYHLRLY